MLCGWIEARDYFNISNSSKAFESVWGEGQRMQGFRWECCGASHTEWDGAGSVSVKKVQGFAAKSAKAWLTDESHDCDEQAAAVESDGNISANVPGKSMVTIAL
jgi:hypothetical protein